MILTTAMLLPSGSVAFHTDDGDYFMDFEPGTLTRGQIFGGAPGAASFRSLSRDKSREVISALHDDADRVPAKVMNVLNAPRKPFKYSNNHWYAVEDKGGKFIWVHGPSELNIRIDFDDVDEDAVEEQTCKLIDLLAANRLRP